MSKTVIITGSSTGIGRASVIKFQEAGWNVVATMRSPEKEEELNKLENVLVTKLDVLDQATIDATVQAALDKFGQIDVLVNNAGYGAFGPMESVPRDKILRQFNTNVIGLMDVMRTVIPHMRERRSGVIINISSVGGRMTYPMFSLYHGTKFAVEGITESMAYEMAPLGIQMKIVEPGAIATDFAGRSLDISATDVPEYQRIIEKLMKGFSENRNVSPASLAADVIFGAATDGTDTIRYTAGEDARVLMANRKQADDATFMAGIRQRFDI